MHYGKIISSMNHLENNNKNLNIEFENAYDLSCKDFSHQELIYMLNNGSIAQKQIAALKFDYVRTENDAKAILQNLTGCDGKIREAVALRINELLLNNLDCRKFFAQIASNKFADGTIDINANICRLVVDSSILLIDFEDFSKPYTDKIITFSNQALEELDKFIFRDKKYVINKQLFKLYWCLEALSIFYNYADNKVLEQILTKCSEVSEYTIREKTALVCVNSGSFNDIKFKLSNDENYYVRQIITSQMP